MAAHGLSCPTRKSLTLLDLNPQTKSPRRTRAARRTAPPEQRRRQLIEASIRSIADYGLAGTTIATVAREAGLSQGIINLHFKTKERLLIETLRFLSD